MTCQVRLFICLLVLLRYACALSHEVKNPSQMRPAGILPWPRPAGCRLAWKLVGHGLAHQRKCGATVGKRHGLESHGGARRPAPRRDPVPLGIDQPGHWWQAREQRALAGARISTHSRGKAGKRFSLIAHFSARAYFCDGECPGPAAGVFCSAFSKNRTMRWRASKPCHGSILGRPSRPIASGP